MGTITDTTTYVCVCVCVQTLNSLKRLLEFGDRVEQMLTTLGSGNWNLQTKTHTKNSANVGIVGSYVRKYLFDKRVYV